MMKDWRHDDDEDEGEAEAEVETASSYRTPHPVPAPVRELTSEERFQYALRIELEHDRLLYLGERRRSAALWVWLAIIATATLVLDAFTATSPFWVGFNVVFGTLWGLLTVKRLSEWIDARHAMERHGVETQIAASGLAEIERIRSAQLDELRERSVLAHAEAYDRRDTRPDPPPMRMPGPGRSRIG